MVILQRYNETGARMHSVREALTSVLILNHFKALVSNWKPAGPCFHSADTYTLWLNFLKVISDRQYINCSVFLSRANRLSHMLVLRTPSCRGRFTRSGRCMKLKFWNIWYYRRVCFLLRSIFELTKFGKHAVFFKAWSGVVFQRNVSKILHNFQPLFRWPKMPKNHKIYMYLG